MAAQANFLDQIFSGGKGKDETVKLQTFQKRERTLVLGDSVYPLANVSVIEVIDLVRRLPLIMWLVLLAGIALFLSRQQLIGLIFMGAFAFAFYSNWQTNQRERYGLRIITNSAASMTLLSGNVEFLRKIRDDLNQRINEQDLAPVTYNLQDNRIVNTGTNYAPITQGSGNTVTSTVDTTVKG